MASFPEERPAALIEATPAGRPPTTHHSTFNITQQPRKWDPEIMGRLTREMENMTVNKELRGASNVGHDLGGRD